ncbi:hypothetical protein GCM10023310_70070 [Paenibacillus vulneris]|uniref:DUF4760 domain-containing protein n=1 Tax=Paenibacillus vulneris TaxID=1133364 RepID=A0ABW3UJ51_9BACL
MVFWRKKKANQLSVMGIVVSLTPFSYRVHDTIMQKDEEFGYFQGKGKDLFTYVMAASIILSIRKLNDDYFTRYYSEILKHLEDHYSNIGKICSDFNDYIRINYHSDNRLDATVLQWLHERVGTGDVSNEVEIKILADGVWNIFDAYDNWFEKNDMPI